MKILGATVNDTDGYYEHNYGNQGGVYHLTQF